MGCSVSKCDINTQMSPIVEDKDTLDAMECLKNQQKCPRVAEVISEALKKIKHIQQLDKDSTSENNYQSRPTPYLPWISTATYSKKRRLQSSSRRSQQLRQAFTKIWKTAKMTNHRK